MSQPSSGHTRPITIAQPNIATVGVVNAGRSGMASEKVPRPVNASSPTNTRNPIPAASRPGSRATAEHRATEPGDLQHQEGGDERRSEQRADRGEAARGGDDGDGARRGVPLHRSDRERSEAAADGDQRCFGPEHRTERQCRQGRQEHTGEFDRAGVGAPAGNPPTASGRSSRAGTGCTMRRAVPTAPTAAPATRPEPCRIRARPGGRSNRASCSQSTSARNPYATTATGTAMSAASTSACR